MNEIVISAEPRQLSAVEVRQHVNTIQEVMKSVMKADTHYGIIPGTQKPTLYKAGAEVLLTTFRLGLRIEVEDLSTPDEIKYRVKTIGFHQPTGTVMGEGIGECSTGEEKYKWRRSVCDEEFDETPETKRRIKYVNSKGKLYKNKQIKTEPADLANTVLKMAKKRAQIDFTLTALAASDIFTQDVEDMPQELRANASEDGRPDTVGMPLEHESLKSAASVQDLSKAMNLLPADERKKYMEYYNIRRKELSEEAA